MDQTLPQHWEDSKGPVSCATWFLGEADERGWAQVQLATSAAGHARACRKSFLVGQQDGKTLSRGRA